MLQLWLVLVVFSVTILAFPPFLIPRVDQMISERDDDAMSFQPFSTYHFPIRKISSHGDDELHAFVTRTGKTYPNAESEAKAKKAFESNRKLVREHNKKANRGQHKFKIGLNKFADTPIEELRQKLLGAKPPSEPVTRLSHAPPPKVGLIRHNKPQHRLKRQEVPGYANYTEWGYSYDVEFQGYSCGSCWAFSAVDTLVTHISFYTGELLLLSEQNLVDCAGQFPPNNGCSGGWPGSAWEYIMANGIMTRDAYPYNGMDGQCQYNQSQKANSYACIGGVNYLPKGDEEAMKTAIYNVGPLSVAINANAPEFMYYEGGIYVDSTCSQEDADINHAVIVTGYGTAADGTDYWIVRNSWGNDWGEAGYVRFARNNNNQCGIASWPHYPELVQCGT